MKNKLTYKRFEKYINEIKKRHDTVSELYEMGIDVIDMKGNMETPLIELLTDALCNIAGVEDQEMLSWWLFEKDFGKDSRMECYDEDDNIIPTDTVLDIWNYYNSSPVRKEVPSEKE